VKQRRGKWLVKKEAPAPDHNHILSRFIKDQGSFKSSSSAFGVWNDNQLGSRYSTKVQLHPPSFSLTKPILSQEA
jgi:hypothetical protein